MPEKPTPAVSTAILKPKEERRLLRGHAWAYRNEFQKLPGAEDGELVDVFSADRHFVGRGFYQAEGGIAVRLLTRHQDAIDASFWAARIQHARDFRERLFPRSRTYRWLHGESDGFPGLTADRYGALVVAHTPCAFYRVWAEALAVLFLQTEGVEGVLFRLDRSNEGFGTVPDELEFDLEGLHLCLNPWAAQKTGLFLDQRCNRMAMRPHAAGRRVLDGHCYHGLWSCHAALAGATEVRGVDTSESALAHARANAERNGVSASCHFECGAIEDHLENGARYGLIIIDPPAFAKSRAQLPKALPRYAALNRAAFAALEPGGILVTCSCSHFLDGPDFREMLKRAAAAAGRNASLLEMRGAAPDHPVLLCMPETEYLKCAILRVD